MLWVLFLILWAFGFWIANVIFCGIAAKTKKRSVLKWSLLGFFFPIISLIAIAGLPAKVESIRPDEN